jgi:hypothetical protein
MAEGKHKILLDRLPSVIVNYNSAVEENEI